jgi:hypothetical protein
MLHINMLVLVLDLGFGVTALYNTELITFAGYAVHMCSFENCHYGE